MNQTHSHLQTIRIELEAAVPYEQSLLWRLHREYYQQEGLGAFLRQEVPSNITSNPCLAGQAVRLLQASLPVQIPSRLTILELGAGSGVFAYNFLTELAQIAPELLPHIDYWLSDYSHETLKSLSEQAAFANWLQQGQLRLCQIDGEQPQQAQDLNGQTVEMPENGFQLIIANYFFSTLPTAVLIRQVDPENTPQEQWLRQITRLDWLPLGEQPTPDQLSGFSAQIAAELRSYRLIDHLTPDHAQYKMFYALQQAQDQVADALDKNLPPLDEDFRIWLETQLAQAWAKALGSDQAESLQATVSSLIGDPLFRRQQTPPREQIRPEHFFEQIDTKALFNSDMHLQAIRNLTAQWPQASLGYSAPALNALGEMVKLTCPEGVVLVSDKAYADADWMRGLNPESATHHGQSLAHPVNFPLFEALMELQGLSTCRTSDPAQALHSLLVYCGDELPDKLSAQFKQDFIDYPRNEISHALLEGGHALMQAERLEEAGRSLQRALNYRPSDGTLQYLLAVCLLNQERYADAIKWLERSNDDLYGLFNREILLAESWRLAGNPERAQDLYKASLRHGENSQTYYNLALCQIELGQIAEAQKSLQSAAKLDPEDSEVQTLLADLPSNN